MSDHSHDEPHVDERTQADGTVQAHEHVDHEHDHDDHDHTHADGTTQSHGHRKKGFLARFFGR